MSILEEALDTIAHQALEIQRLKNELLLVGLAEVKQERLYPLYYTTKEGMFWRQVPRGWSFPRYLLDQPNLLYIEENSGTPDAIRYTVHSLAFYDPNLDQQARRWDRINGWNKE